MFKGICLASSNSLDGMIGQISAAKIDKIKLTTKKTGGYNMFFYLNFAYSGEKEYLCTAF